MAALVLAGAARAADDPFGSGKLLATSGISLLEGAGGGAMAPWAVITGYGTRDQIGANAHYSFVSLPDFELHSVGAAVGFYDRVELSYAHLWFQTGDTGARLWLGKDFAFQQNVFGAKLKLVGDAVYDQDSWLPQIALGALYKQTDHGDVLKAIGVRHDSGLDLYLAATKLLLDQSLLLSGSVISTRANQLGILGNGGDRSDGYGAAFAGSAALLVARDLAVGAEYRTNPSNLRFTEQNDWKDVFVAYFIDKHASLTLAYVDLGTVATVRDQHGFFLSAQFGL
jgi:hypothetical protein